MTREEAIEILKAHHMWTGEPQEIIDVRKENKALEMAIQALSQEPCEDDRNNLCSSCTNIGCEFQSGIVRTKCAFYMPPHIETDNCGNYVVMQPVRPQEPCEDCISRQAVNTLVDELARAISDERCCIPQRGRDTGHIMHDILDLPSVNPQPCDDAISREAVIELIERGVGNKSVTIDGFTFGKSLMLYHVKQLPSVTQKSGKWIKVKSGDKDFPESIVCSRCSNENSHLDFKENAEPIGKVFVTSKFCPNCGAKMESEDKE